MESIGIIPARYGSTRFEGKVLKDLCGKPVIQHVYERAKKAKLLDELIVAADDDRIIQAVEKFGGKAVFTSKSHSTGTDRLTEIVNEIDVRIVVNIQGDEPLINPLVIDDLVRTMQDDRSEEHTSELQSQSNLVCRLLLEKHNKSETHAIQPCPSGSLYYRSAPCR